MGCTLPLFRVPLGIVDVMDTLHFERYEYKYLVPEAWTEAIRRFIHPYVELDKHAARAPDRRYTIHSVYLDTPNLDLYTAAVRDEVDRFKLRIRSYDDDLNGPFFCEVKRKIRQVIVKDRALISRRDCDALLSGQPITLPAGASADNLAAFQERAVRTGAIPMLFSRYTREPYESVFGEYSRITFDRAMCFQMFAGAGFHEDPDAWTYIDGAGAMHGLPCAMVVELKFTRNFPRWMSDLVAEFDLERRRYSKFVSAVSHHLQSGFGGPDFQRHAWIDG